MTEKRAEEIPAELYHFGLVQFLWLRIIGYKDKYGRKAKFIGFKG